MLNRKEYLLSFEGLVYFFLALLDLLSHNAASIRDSLPNFKALDIFIGSSFLYCVCAHVSFQPRYLINLPACAVHVLPLPTRYKGPHPLLTCPFPVSRQIRASVSHPHDTRLQSCRIFCNPHIS